MTTMKVELLSLRECVRKRPGMYFGDVHESSGVLHLVLDVIANALDLALVGRCTRIDVELGDDDSVTVSDDGPGIPTDRDGRPSLVELLEWRDDAPTVDGHRPHVHLGLGAIGLAVVNAASALFELTTVCDGKQATARYSRGIASEPLRVEPATLPSGTRVHLRPDPQIFASVRVPRDDLHQRLMSLSFLMPQVRLSWTGAEPRHGQGLPELIRMSAPATLGGTAHVRQEVDTETGPIDVEVALGWREDSLAEPVIHGFANMERTREHGTHVEGLLDGLRSFFPRRGAAARREGLVAAVAVILSDVKFGSPVRDKLVTPAARPAVKQVTMAALRAWAAAYPEAAAIIRARGL
jgi:DNA gyrase subunit B